GFLAAVCGTGVGGFGIRNPQSEIRRSAISVGGGVWESNPPAPALTGALTVLKTAPLTRADAPPLHRRDATNPKCPTRRLSSFHALNRRGTRPRRLPARLT